MSDREWLIKQGVLNESDHCLSCDGEWIDPPAEILALPVSIRYKAMRRLFEADIPDYAGR